MDAVFFLLSTIKISKKNHGCLTRKAIGITGGVIASDQLFINQLLSSSFISSAGMSPAFAEAMGEAAALYKTNI
jgi:7-keto-8-aminopelargonate synthetase-like enzyme